MLMSTLDVNNSNNITSAMVAQSKSNEDKFLLEGLKDNSAILCEYRKFGKSKGPTARE